MNPMSAAALTYMLSFTVFTLAAIWYVAPWLMRRSRGEALITLLWIHAFRYVALYFFPAQRSEFAISDAARDQLAAGGVLGMILALMTIISLRYGSRASIILAWTFAAETLLDLVGTSVAGVREGFFDTATGASWLILTFYLPLLWVSLALIVKQLFVRRFEPVAAAA